MNDSYYQSLAKEWKLEPEEITYVRRAEFQEVNGIRQLLSRYMESKKIPQLVRKKEEIFDDKSVLEMIAEGHSNDVWYLLKGAIPTDWYTT